VTMNYKNMKHLLYLSAFFASLIFILASCGGPSPANNTGNANNANGNLANTGASTKPPEAPTLNNAPTLGPVVQQYYQALEKKDDAAVRETLTKEFIAQLEEEMKADKEKNLAAFMARDEYRPGQTLEVRNEKIEGDKGQAEIRGGAYKNWTAFS